MINQAVF